MSEKKSRIECPCCRLLTITESGSSEVCSVCHWQDDGQAEDNASQVLSGANGKYSLSKARENFSKNCFMYGKKDSKFPTNPNLLLIQEELIDLYTALKKSPSNSKILKMIGSVEKKKSITPNTRNSR